MKKILIVAAAGLLLVAGCKGGKKAAGDSVTEPEAAASVAAGPKVMAREVPERMDDFVFENDLIAGRFYGKALEGNPTSPGLDVWVKLPGKLVADNWYAHAVSDPEYYHHDHGGKDCYKVSVSLGGGASAPLVGGKLRYPATNWREAAVLSQSDDAVTFVLKYPAWDAGGVSVRLEKTVTVTAGSYFCKVEDRYYGDFQELEIAAGFWIHEWKEDCAMGTGDDFIALWEPASDQSVEPEDGMIGIALVMPAEHRTEILDDGEKRHHICIAKVRSGEPLTYWFGSCWSKGDIKDFQQWTNTVKSQAGAAGIAAASSN